MACRDGCGCPQEARDARTDEWVGTQTPPPASMAGPVARLQAEKAPVEVQGPDGRSEGGFDEARIDAEHIEHLRAALADPDGGNRG